MAKVVVFLAEGFEDVEAVTPIDFLRRAGVEVTIVGVGAKVITSAHGIRMEADVELEALEDETSYDGLVCPGGMPGAENIASEQRILDMIDSFNLEGKTVAAICASPGVILARTGALKGRKATSYPGFEKYFGDTTEASTDRVVVDGNLITSRGPGTSAEFSIELIRRFADDDTAEKIKSGTLQLF